MFRDENRNRAVTKAGRIDWLSVLRSENYLRSPIHERVCPSRIDESDESILAQLRDITLTRNRNATDAEGKPIFTSYSLNFVFGPNIFFENEVLTVDFHLRDGAELPIYDLCEEKELLKFRNCNGCTINWRPGMKPKALITATQGGPRGVGYDLYDSFFTFFDPPKLNDKTVRKIFTTKTPKGKRAKYILNGWDYASYKAHYQIGFDIALEVIPQAKQVHEREIEKAWLENLPLSDDNRFVEL